MEATQTDIENPQPTGQEDGTVDGIAGGILDMLENTDPNSSGTVESKPEESTEETTETSEETTETPEEPDKFIIKWQGQDKEVTQDELLDLAQKGFDYTQKTQTLADERNQLAPIQGLATILRNDPLKAAQIAAIISGQASQTQPDHPTVKKFDDPIDELEDRILQKARAERQQELVPLHRQAALNQVRQAVQADPDFKEVHQAIIDMVKAQPRKIQEAMFLQLDQDPASYVEAFQHFKNLKAQKPTTTEPLKPVKKETRAPILEAGGVSAPEGIEGKAKAERISKMKAKALRSGDPSAVADWLQTSGALDHLF